MKTSSSFLGLLGAATLLFTALFAFGLFAPSNPPAKPAEASAAVKLASR